ncbi:hypothetical protein EMIHUDRAFT_75525 [Emiliania huxleyi CCMP1516]|uniref:Leucine-rich repeat domain-containing protein n=2 Tax=Emiliania huxleyi TaxID=2903 RepID=A0A0D3J6K7_EMIH1|nr:hypothetical protein EMIHUDRAFT_75525 [Emiliania huxleyi CCMP1516]EOD19142.1 hypothetical protein EMIHUDRAFT_75525 [Emiliania huxleyi CCMP1516]|eukprot:XP_005771571.1 hypothetical protein EMIHUDRAFT_75525 [Emiliania huxleyi CCMP1516]
MRKLREIFRYFKSPPPDPKPWDGYHCRVEVPDGTTHIPRRAFYAKPSLRQVTIPSSLVSVGSYSFMSCGRLSSITLPDDWKDCSVGKYAFAESGIRSMDLPAGLKVLRRGTFSGCRNLRDIRLPASLERIGPSAFLWCHDLNHVKLPDGLISIGRLAFSYNASLASITFPASLAMIEHGAFSSCGALKQVVVPTTTEIAEHTFPPCTRVVRLPPARMRARQHWHAAVDAAVALKRCRPQLYGWLERAQNRLGAYGPDGAARQRDREEFESDRLLSQLTRASSSEDGSGSGI